MICITIFRIETTPQSGYASGLRPDGAERTSRSNEGNPLGAIPTPDRPTSRAVDSPHGRL